MSDTHHTLSVIVVAFNEQDHVARLLQALRAQLDVDDLTVETILVDGGSSDDTLTRAREAGYDRIVEAPGANIPVCRNRGLTESRGEWVAYIDADCEPAPDWLSTARRFLDQPDPLIIGWPVEPPRPGTWVQRIWHTHWSTKNRHRDTWQGESVVREEGFRLLTTRNLLLHRQVAEALDGFDEKLSTGEDTDFCFRAYHSGFPTLGVPGLRMIHHGEPATLRAFYRQQTWHANRSSYRRILSTGGGKSGGNAVRFTILYLATLVIAAGCSAAGAWQQEAWWLAGWLPWLGLVGGPAALIGFKARKLHHVPGLAVLYAAYGWARMLDLLGVYRSKRSWKS